MTVLTLRVAVTTVPALIESAKALPSVPEIPTVGTRGPNFEVPFSARVITLMSSGALLKMIAATAPILPARPDFSAKVHVPREIRAMLPVIGSG